MPKTASSGDIQRNYRSLFNEIMVSGEPLFVLNNNKPEVVIISIKTFEALTQSHNDYEQAMAQKAIANYKHEKQSGTLKELSSLADLTK